MAVYADRTAKAGPRLLIGNLALCGFIFRSGLFPLFTMIDWLPPSYIPSSCDLVCATIFFMAVVSWADVCLAINRTVAICFPHRYDIFRRRKITWTLIVSSWTISAAIAVLARTQTGVTFVTLNSGACSVVIVSPFAEFYMALCIVIPYLMIGGASVGIFSTASVRMRRPMDNAMEALKIKRLMQRRLIIAKAMVTSLVWNVLCSLPTLLILSAFVSETKIHPWLDSLVTLDMDILYAMNPVSGGCSVMRSRSELTDFRFVTAHLSLGQSCLSPKFSTNDHSSHSRSHSQITC